MNIPIDFYKNIKHYVHNNVGTSDRDEMAGKMIADFVLSLLTPSGDVQERAKEYIDWWTEELQRTGEFVGRYKGHFASPVYTNLRNALYGTSSMQGEVERVKDSYSERNEGWEKAIDLQAENERLREALEEIIGLYPNSDRDGRPVIALNDIRQTAIEALNKQ